MLFRIPLPNQTKCEKQRKTKTCKGCGKTKALTEYHKQKLGKYGVRSKCKVCRNATHAKWRAENVEKRQA